MDIRVCVYTHTYIQQLAVCKRNERLNHGAKQNQHIYILITVCVYSPAGVCMKTLPNNINEHTNSLTHTRACIHTCFSIYKW